MLSPLTASHISMASTPIGSAALALPLTPSLFWLSLASVTTSAQVTSSPASCEAWLRLRLRLRLRLNVRVRVRV